ncbi:MAG: hypothetical protein M3335_12055 [Actinomycetota bacterium]|nr:hypothetical protein [Actinomycetota bacterium]
MEGGAYIAIAVSSGLAAAIIGKAKGSSFFLWFLVGAVIPILGIVAVILYRREHDEPERLCPRCGSVQKLYVQVCSVCGEELFLPDPREVRQPGERAPGVPR